jgi:hypothetical protein
VGEPLDDSVNIMDVIAGWEKEHPDIPIQFSFHRYVLLNKRGEPRDPTATHLLCHQAIGQVVTGRHLVSEDDAVLLAAMQLRMKHDGEINWDEVAYVPPATPCFHSMFGPHTTTHDTHDTTRTTRHAQHTRHTTRHTGERFASTFRCNS